MLLLKIEEKPIRNNTLIVRRAGDPRTLCGIADGRNYRKVKISNFARNNQEDDKRMIRIFFKKNDIRIVMT